MNEIIDSLNTRKSVRAYAPKAVPPAVKTAILRAATQAPTAGNQQLYTILDITDQAIKDQLSVTCDRQPFIAKAPLVLVFCADCQKWYDAYREAGCAPRLPAIGDLILAMEDATIAAQNAVVAAESLGLGSCYIGDIMEQCGANRALLGLPQYVFPAVMLVLGYPTQQQMERPKPERFDLQYIVQENGYHTMDGSRLREMFAERTGDQDFETWIAAFCKRKYNSDFSQEMSRSVGEYLEQFGEVH